MVAKRPTLYYINLHPKPRIPSYIYLLAPQSIRTVASIWAAAQENKPGANFYRAEPVPPNRGGGPPYSLLQGDIPLGRTLAREGGGAMKDVMRGYACSIPSESRDERNRKSIRLCL